jgi:hypothetical protein
MLAEQVRKLHLLLDNVYQPIRQTIMEIFRCPGALKGKIEKELYLWQVFHQMHGVCMTCMAMSQSGVRTGSGIFLLEMFQTLPGLQVAMIV